MSSSKKSKTFTRSANLGTSLIHESKWKVLDEIYDEAKRVSDLYLLRLDKKQTAKFAGKDLYNLVTEQDSWLTARLKQQCCAFAVSTLKSVHARISRLKWIQDQQDDKTTNACKKREKLIKSLKSAQPKITDFSLNLNGNSVKFNAVKNVAKHENWVRLTSIGNSIKVDLPFMITPPFKKWSAKGGELSKFLQIKGRIIKCVFTMPVPKLRETGHVVGCDIGMRNVCTFDNGCQTQSNNLGRNLMNINKKIKRCKSKVKQSKFRTEYVQHVKWAVNLINWGTAKCVKVENIFNFHAKGFTQGWLPTVILNKIESVCQEKGIKFVKVPAPYTSQRCHECGWTAKANRPNGEKMFKCKMCKIYANADVNAAKNIKSEHSKFNYKRPSSTPGVYISKKWWKTGKQ